MQSLQDQLAIYQQHHQKSSTKMTHYFGIPMIFMGIAMFLNWFTITAFAYWTISFTWLALMALLIYYFVLNARIALAATVILFILTYFATLIAGSHPSALRFSIFLIFFMGGWILQFVGHYFEKNKPAFMQSITQTLIAPIFILLEIAENMGWKSFFNIENKA